MRLLRALTVSLSLTVPLTAFSQPNGDTLKQTFAEIAFAHQLRTIHLVAYENSNKETTEVLTAALQAEQLDFTVNVLADGAVSEIANTKMSDLISDAHGRRLVIAHIGFDTNGVREDQADVKWSDGSYGNSGDLSKYTLRQALVEGKADTSCQRYVRASITATYKGQSGQWNALYLVGCASAKVVVADLVMANAVEKFWDANVYPSSLLGLHIFRENEAVKAWLRNNASSTCATKTACFENGKIRIPQADLPPLTSKVVVSPQTNGTQGVRHQADCSQKRVNVAG